MIKAAKIFKLTLKTLTINKMMLIAKATYIDWKRRDFAEGIIYKEAYLKRVKSLKNTNRA